MLIGGLDQENYGNHRKRGKEGQGATISYRLRRDRVLVKPLCDVQHPVPAVADAHGEEDPTAAEQQGQHLLTHYRVLPVRVQEVREAVGPGQGLRQVPPDLGAPVQSHLQGRAEGDH